MRQIKIPIAKRGALLAIGIFIPKNIKLVQFLQLLDYETNNQDIIERFSVKNEEVLKALLRLLLNETTYSLTKLYNTIKSKHGSGSLPENFEKMLLPPTHKD